jgi:hypothetical protein
MGSLFTINERKLRLSTNNLNPTLARRQYPQSSGELPISIREYLQEIAFIAGEAATTSNATVARLGLKLLARQSQTLRAITEGLE